MRNCIKDSSGYQLVKEFYRDRTAERSGVRLMNHIDEGLVVLEEIWAGVDAMEAFCVHPLIQADEDLAANFERVSLNVSANVLALAMEYRSVANEYLSPKVNTGHKIRLSPLKAVNDMLIADKVQNRKDFYTYHWGKHERSDELELYFAEWLDALEVPEDEYVSLCAAIEAAKHHESEIAELRRKNRIYETTFHRIQMCEITGDNRTVSKIVKEICDWSRAHRAGNGELSEKEEEEQIERALRKLKDSL